MKILYLIDTLAIGGAEKSLLEILSRFQQTQPILCYLYPKHALKPAYEAAGIPVISLNISGKYAFGAATRAVVNVIRREQPDLIHTTLFWAGIVGRLAGKWAGIPVIDSFVNDSYTGERRQQLSPLGRLKLRGVQLIDMATAPFVSQFTAISETIKVSNAKALRISPDKINVIYRGRDPQRFGEISLRQINDIKQNLGLPVDANVLLNVARLLERKGQADLIRAMPAVLKEWTDAHLVIAGEGACRHTLEALIQDLALSRNVHLPGTRPDIPKLLHMADLFVFPSHYEGHGGALVEAMFAGRPIVASNTAVHRESVTANQTGVLVPVKNPSALAKGICNLLSHPAKAARLGAQAREVAMQRFHIDQIAAHHEQMYASLLARANGGHKSPGVS